MKTIYFDVETTGLNPVKNDIIQMAGMIEIDGEIKEKFNYKMQPFSYENIMQSALDTHGISVETIKTYAEPRTVYREMISLFNKYIDSFNKADKFVVCGYNVRFDIDFLSQFFRKNNDNYLFAYFGAVKDPFPIPDSRLVKTILKEQGIEKTQIAYLNENMDVASESESIKVKKINTRI